MTEARLGRPEEQEEQEAQQVKKKAKTGLAVGDMLPDFEVETDSGETLSSKDLTADSGAVIFFYPRANTGGCTTQACGFRDNYGKLVASGYKVYGMSADKPKSQANWKAKHSFQYPLLCDPSFKALKALGVNKGDKGIRRSHLVIAKGGQVEQVHYDVSPKESIAEAAKLIKEGVEEAAPAEEAAAEEAPAVQEAAEAPAAAHAAADAAMEDAAKEAAPTAEAKEEAKENGAAAAAVEEKEKAAENGTAAEAKAEEAPAAQAAPAAEAAA